jgi:hypothetical protein
MAEQFDMKLYKKTLKKADKKLGLSTKKKDELAEKCITSPNSILGNIPDRLVKPVTPFSCPVRVPEKGTPESDDAIHSHVFDAQMYALDRGFIKKDSGKLQWSLMPFEELKDVVKVLMLGAVKYSPDNWKKCDNVVRYKDALMRHVISYIEGDEIDEESGLSHLAHAVCNCLFLMWFDKQKSKD